MQIMYLKIRLIVLISSLVLSFYSMSQEKWEEVRSENEIVIIKDIGFLNEEGYVIAQKNDTVNIIVADDLGKAGEIVVNDLDRYLQLALQSKIKILSEKDKESIDGKNVIILARKESENLLKWSGLDDKVNDINIREQECLIIPSKIKMNNSNEIVLIGGSKRGLLNGVYTFLEKSSMAIHWYPPRIYYNNENSFPAETFLTKADKLVWNEGEMHWKPALTDNICHGNFSRKFIDWASRNRMNIFVARPSPRDIISSEKEREVVDYAHELDLKVIFLGMTHRLPNDIANISHSSDTALAMSTKLYSDMFREYNIDGMAWHTASESITLNMDEKYHKKSRIEWESIYLNSYERAIREIKEDAMLVMLMGWVYMDPADEIAKYVNKNIISWIVPRTPIIDAAVADIDEYEKYFDRIWYWLYSGVSADGQFPIVKIDYLENYLLEAIKRDHGIAGQGIPSSNAANVMYLVESGRDGVVSPETFLQKFGELYYGDSKMGSALLKYQEALKNHRNWFNNIHTRDVENNFSTYEALLLKDVYNTVIDCAKTAKTPLLKDRLKAMAVTTIRCFVKRGKTDVSKLIVSENDINKMIDETKSLFSDHYFGAENDFFWDELVKLEDQQVKETSMNK